VPSRSPPRVAERADRTSAARTWRARVADLDLYLAGARRCSRRTGHIRLSEDDPIQPGAEVVELLPARGITLG
jgi:hypothetical protein